MVAGAGAGRGDWGKEGNWGVEREMGRDMVGEIGAGRFAGGVRVTAALAMPPAVLPGDWTNSISGTKSIFSGRGGRISDTVSRGSTFFKEEIEEEDSIWTVADFNGDVDVEKEDVEKGDDDIEMVWDVICEDGEGSGTVAVPVVNDTLNDVEDWDGFVENEDVE